MKNVEKSGIVWIAGGKRQDSKIPAIENLVKFPFYTEQVRVRPACSFNFVCGHRDRVFTSCSDTLSLGEKRSGYQARKYLAKYRRFSTALTGCKRPVPAGCGKGKGQAGNIFENVALKT